jgi:hypothetical protein
MFQDLKAETLPEMTNIAAGIAALQDTATKKGHHVGNKP